MSTTQATPVIPNPATWPEPRQYEAGGTAGGVIRIAREAMGLTQTEFGALFGEGRRYISQIERDERPVDEVLELAAAIGARLARP